MKIFANTRGVQMRNEILQKYQLIIRNSHEIIIFFDKEGYIIDMNTEACNQLGYQESFKNISITSI